ncbi:MAG: hypothetical protein DCC55_00755 [Chloroflexi bacterium]|nr:MAG: hypothetical protein DCC55_00755 [Chloroflexota bacterium]
MIAYLRRGGYVGLLLAVMGAASGCGLLIGTGPEPTPVPVDIRQLVPTFTATPVEIATPTPTETVAPPVADLPPTEAPDSPAVEEEPAEVATPEPTATPSPQAQLTITQDQVNVRLGPGTEYGLAGEATRGQSFEIIGKNQQGDWWQICCINGQQVWIFGQLATVADAEAVPVVTDLPAQPVAQAPTLAPQPQPQEQPTPTPEPQAEAPPPPADDPCANIGGDGCKFRVSGGPAFAPNGGTELKLQFMFKHSGDGGRPQGSYFVAMFKDGQKLPISDGTRSQVDVRQQGMLGEYNYEYKVGLSDIPGNNVAGNYVLYVLDGNGERDSRDVPFSVPDGQGEIWIEFDQG